MYKCVLRGINPIPNKHKLSIQAFINVRASYVKELGIELALKVQSLERINDLNLAIKFCDVYISSFK